MRFKYFILVIVLISISLLLFFFQLQNFDNNNLDKAPLIKKIKIEEITIKLPIFLNLQKTENSNNWKIHSFSGKRVYFRVSITNGNTEKLKSIVKNDLKIDKLPDNSSFILSKLCFIKRLQDSPLSFYYIQHKNKTNHYVFTFPEKDSIYYIDMFTPSTDKKYKTLFDRILLSIENSKTLFKNRNKVSRELDSICKETNHILCQSKKTFVFGLPLIVGIAIIFIFLLFTSNMGKLPENLLSSGIIPIYTEEDIDTVIKIFSKRKWIATAMVIENNGIHFYYRRKEIIFLDREKASNSLKEGKSFLGRYLKLETDKRNLKNTPINLNLYLKNKITFHFYFKDIEKVKTYLNSLL